MKNSHLFGTLMIFMFIVILSLLTVVNIRISPLMITVIVLSSFFAGMFYHYKKANLTGGKVAELALLAFIVQLSAISFL